MVTQQKFRPPYPGFKTFLTLLKVMIEKKPVLADGSFIRKYKIGGRANESKLLFALRFFGLINQENKTTEEFLLLRARGEEHYAYFRKLISKSYAPLLARIDIENLARDEVFNYLVATLGMDYEAARKASRFFINICYYARTGINVKSRKPKKEKPLRLYRADVILTNAPVNIVLPSDTITMSQGKLNGYIARVVEASRKALEGGGK